MTAKKFARRECRFCKADISDMRADAKVCWEAQCRASFSRELYAARRTLKECASCGIRFEGTRQRTHCKACVSAIRKSMFSNIAQEIRCKYCKMLLRTKIVKSNRGLSVRYTAVCKPCLKTRKRSEKLGPKNPNWKGGLVKPKLTKPEVSELHRRRMVANNPMKSKATVDKVISTRRAHKEDGSLTYKRGTDHHLWKGNREPSFVIRTRILSWNRAVLARDGFKCTKCKKNRHLEVHHLRPFRDIVALCMRSLNIKSLKGINVSDRRFSELCDLVLKEHQLEDGITYCTWCHEHADPLRRAGITESK